MLVVLTMLVVLALISKLYLISFCQMASCICGCTRQRENQARLFHIQTIEVHTRYQKSSTAHVVRHMSDNTWSHFGTALSATDTSNSRAPHHYYCYEHRNDGPQIVSVVSVASA